MQKIGVKLLCFCMFFSTTLYAEPNKPKMGWSGKGGLGFVFARGNTETDTLNADINIEYDAIKWHHKAGLAVLRTNDGDTTTANRYSIAGQTNYKITDRSNWFFSLRYEDDEFSGFEYQASAAAGYGYKVLNTAAHKLNIGLGIGAKTIEETGTNNEETFVIGKGAVDYIWNITGNTSFENNFLIEGGSENTFIENKMGLSVAMNNVMALKIGFNSRHNTDVIQGRDKTDTVSTVSLTYKF